MRNRSSMRSLPVLALGVLTLAATEASGQPVPDVRLSAVEVSLGLTVNGLAQDVNSGPDCLRLSLPCTHAAPGRVSGLGLNLSVSRNLNDRFAIAADLSRFRIEWDHSDSGGARRRAGAHATSVSAGPRISTGFHYPGNGDRQPGRFFGQVLVGAETSDVVPLRPALLVGGGSDVIIPWGDSPDTSHVRSVTFRLAFDYRLTPGTGRNLSGWRFVLGFVFGPRMRCTAAWRAGRHCAPTQHLIRNE